MVAIPDGLAIELLLAAFAGGAFGAAIGALPSFALTGAMVVLGEAYAALHRTLSGSLPAVDITGTVAFGPVLGPHVAFAGGAAATAYAAKRGYLDTDFDYHEAKHITRGLGARWDVLAVGGAFGVFGHVVAVLSGAAGVPTDPIALGVVLSALAHRLAFGYSLLGAPLAALLDMAPDDRDVEVWLPYQTRWRDVTVLGLVVGALGGFLAVVTGSAFVAFGLTAASLAFLAADVADVPVTHHMALPASTIVVALTGVSAGTVDPAAVTAAISPAGAVVLGAAVGAVGGLLGELAQRVFYAHAETHLDPPAASIVVTSLAIAGLAVVGVLPGSAWVPLP